MSSERFGNTSRVVYRTRPRPPSAFTLVELLVVVAIVALLAALIMPTLKRARYITKLALCGSNLHQVGVGVLNYCSSARAYWPYRKVSFCSNPRHSNLKYAGTDDRPMLRPFFDINFLVCPFSPLEGETDLDKSMRTHVHSSYEMFFGSAVVRGDRQTHLLRKSDTILHNGHTFRILAADLDWDYQSISQQQCSHPDDAGLLHFEHRNNHLASQDKTHTMAHWWNANHVRGRLDRNFLHTDGSVHRLYGLSMYDERLVQLPAKNNSPNAALFHYLPPE